MTSTPPRLCRNCGAAISDRDTLPAATLCPTCRRQQLGIHKYQTVTGLLPAIHSYFEELGWPAYVRPSLLIEEDPALLGIVGVPNITSARILLSRCVKELEGPQGQRYTPYSNKGRLLRLTPCDELPQQEATA